MAVIKNIKKVLVWILISAAALASYSFVSHQRNIQLISEIDIKIVHNNELGFVSEAEIWTAILKLYGDSLKHHGVKSINIHEIEEKLSEHKHIGGTEVFKDINGNLNIHVHQRVPVLRVINRRMESFYIDNRGKVFPFSSNFTADILAANGNIAYSLEYEPSAEDSILIEELYNFAVYIAESRFWQAQLIQIHVADNGDALLVPRVGDHIIRLGSLTDFEQKLVKLRAVYEHGFNKLGWDQYKEIDLRYQGQVVCAKKY